MQTDTFSFDYHGLDWDASRECGAPCDSRDVNTARLTVVWVTTLVSAPPTAEISRFAASVAVTAAGLLAKWKPYLERFVYWHDQHYRDSYTSFSLAPNGTLVRENGHALPQHSYWKD